MARIDIVPEDGRWKAKKGGRTQGTAQTQSSLISEVRDLEPSGTNVYVHGRNGQIRDQFTVR